MYALYANLRHFGDNSCNNSVSIIQNSELNCTFAKFTLNLHCVMRRTGGQDILGKAFT